MNLIKGSLKYAQVTLAVLAIVVFAGVYSLLNMPRREDPKITIRTALVVAFYPGANSAQVEEQVAKKIEQYLFGYSEVRKDKTYSTSRDGVVVVNVELQENVKNPDVFWGKLRQDMLQARLLDLPNGVIGPIVNSDFGDTIAMLIGVASDDLSNQQLLPYIRQIEDDLRTIPSVSKIKRIGEQEEQITVTADTRRLAQYGIKFPQVVQVLKAQNVIGPTGNLKVSQSQVPLYAKGYFGTEQQVSDQIVGVSPSGGVVRLGDATNIKREYAEPSTAYRVDGQPAMLLSLEILEGNNVVKFGNTVKEHLAEIQKTLPSNVRITTIVDQPHIVQTSVNDFIREFFLAIISVVIVTILLLPFRIAAVAAMAIPVTVAVTFALLHAFGIELQQVSLAALIVVLGMVVDDAIVIADNYVELLDEGMDRWTAAWRSASDLIIPVLTATVTIIAAFLPLGFLLTGSVGEFIYSLPITVTIALASSFVVAMLLTPYLCYKFIKKGLHDHSAPQGQQEKKRPSLLDAMQNGYDQLIDWSMKRKGVIITVSLLSIVGAGVLFLFVNQKFFPAAERNQFVMEVWLPTGARVERTESALRRMESLISKDERVTSFVSFAGTSAPRFYYNFSPEFPTSNFGQILVNTNSNEDTEELAAELSGKLAKLVPEGRARVRLMQQGSVALAPVEVRVTGPDITRIREIGSRVQQILRKTQGTEDVHTNFMEDYYGIDMNLKEEGNRMGFTTSSVAASTYAGFSGYTATTLYEGDQPINVMLRLDSANRRSFEDIQNLYVSSPVTGADVPLRQIADLKADWQTGRIVRRNGVRTMSVLSEVQPGSFASGILKTIRPEISNIPLPPGYRITYGGEYENQKETFSQMVGALLVSLLMIFLVLLFQFRNIKEALLIMLSIPLSLFGAILGLVMTGNPFGFTAFIGLISLSGIVVRNAIILVDHTNLLIREQGMDIPTAAAEAGKRRLRPIFLTAAAAAIGVVPMILSGSPLWSPLASVLAVGVLFSMVMAVVAIPVLYTMIVKPSDSEFRNEEK